MYVCMYVYMYVCMYVFIYKQCSSNPDEEDAKTILQQFSIQKYLKMHSSSNQRRSKFKSLFCLQLIRPENKRHLVHSCVGESFDISHVVVCLNEIKMGVVAKAVIYPVFILYNCINDHRYYR